MKKILILLLTCLLISGLQAQVVRKQAVVSEVKSATVFLNGAQVTRQATAAVASGKNQLTFSGLSPFLDPQSIQVKTDEDVTILSVNHQIDFLKQQETSDLQRRIDVVRDSLEYEKAILSVLEEEEQFLKENRNIGGSQTGYQLSDLQEITSYYTSRLKELKVKRLEVQKRMKVLEEIMTQLMNQLRELNSDQKLNASNIIITLSADRPQTLQIEVSYLTQNAGWYPSYDLRVKDIGSPIALAYKANVRQNTGEDWKEVTFSFSNADPNQSGQLPDLIPYYLDFHQVALGNALMGRVSGVAINGIHSHSVSGRVTDSESGAALSGVNVVAQGTSVRTLTDINGNFNLGIPAGVNTLHFSYIGYQSQEVPISGQFMIVALTPDMQSLQEVVVTGDESAKRRSDQPESDASMNYAIPTTAVEHQTSIAFTVDIPYTVWADGENYIVDLATYEIPAAYEYQSIPKIDEAAFLVAKISDWNQYNLLEGEANLFFEGTYIGRSLLDVRYVSDTLQLSLGRDRNVTIKREKVKDFTRKQLIGTHRIETRGWKFSVRNNKKQKIHLILKDQIPVSTTSEIEIENITLQNGKLNKENGTVLWKLELAPAVQEERLLQYSIKYPKHRNVMIE